MASHLDREPCTSVRYPHDLGSSREARGAMRAELRDAGLGQQEIEKAELILGELIANAVEHGSPGDDGLIEASWCFKERVLHLSVLGGAAEVTELRAGALTSEAARGRGLAIVDYLCERWRVDAENGVRVTAELVLA